MAKVAFLINSMEGGGAERVLSILLKRLSFKPVLIVLEDKFDYDISKEVKIIKFSSSLDNNFSKIWNLIFSPFKLKKIIKKNNIDLVVSFMERSNYINILARFLGSKHKIYISERCNPTAWYSNKDLKSLFNLFMIKRLYKKADLIIANSIGVKECLANDFSLEDVKVIYNPLDFEEIDELAKEELEEKDLFESPVIISVGRVIKEKGYEYLIRAFKIVKKRIPEAKLIILGKGGLNNEKDVYFLGWKKNPFKYLAKSDIFVFSSLTEGFPNSLLEAMACRLPVISFDCPSGPKEIIKDDNGILVSLKDEKALADSMVKLLESSFLRQEFGQKARKRAEEFSVKNIINQYEELI
jgi:N-acetylgalactosamine-N,N'-diacetylbacillosaminyl-diphospho-undecaprenol 4-alpha-N-acetylgalactosaminyltransferase